MEAGINQSIRRSVSVVGVIAATGLNTPVQAVEAAPPASISRSIRLERCQGKGRCQGRGQAKRGWGKMIVAKGNGI